MMHEIQKMHFDDDAPDSEKELKAKYATNGCIAKEGFCAAPITICILLIALPLLLLVENLSPQPSSI
jgi:hypothetical protein